MRYVVIDSGDGDEIGSIEVDSNSMHDDEAILETLVAGDYLDGEAGDYEITDGDFGSDDGERTVRDADGPVLTLSPEVDADFDSDDDDEDDDDLDDLDDLDDPEDDDDD